MFLHWKRPGSCCRIQDNAVSFSSCHHWEVHGSTGGNPCVLLLSASLSHVPSIYCLLAGILFGSGSCFYPYLPAVLSSHHIYLLCRSVLPCPGCARHILRKEYIFLFRQGNILYSR